MDKRLRHAVAVGRFGSFSKAAQIAGITQSAATKSVAELERRLGYPIFQRTSKGVVPTEEGRIFLERSQRLLQDADELLRPERPGQCMGSLRVGIYPAVLEWLLPCAVDTLLQRHPRIRLDVSSGTQQSGPQRLERGDVDIAIGVASSFAGRSQFVCHPVATLVPQVFVRHGHPLLARERPTKADLAAYAFILPRQVLDFSVYPDFVALHPDGSDRCHQIESTALACKIAQSSDAIGLIDAAFARTASFRQRFAVLEGLSPIPPVQVCCALRSLWDPKPAALALIDCLQTAHADGVARGDMDNRLLEHELAELRRSPQPTGADGQAEDKRQR